MRSDQDYHLRRERDENAAADAASDTTAKARHRDLALRHGERASGRIVVGSRDFGLAG